MSKSTPVSRTSVNECLRKKRFILNPFLRGIRFGRWADYFTSFSSAQGKISACGSRLRMWANHHTSFDTGETSSVTNAAQTGKRIGEAEGDRTLTSDWRKPRPDQGSQGWPRPSASPARLGTNKGAWFECGLGVNRHLRLQRPDFKSCQVGEE